MKPKTQERHYESAHEEFARRVKELYQLADKMGVRVTVMVRRRSNALCAEVPNTRAPQREPGEN